MTNSDSLRSILENIHRPGKLDSHPWSARPFVKDALARHPEWGRQSPGAQLTLALAEFFAQTIPPGPPRRGKRLDTRWAEFALLAAQYFAPIQFGAPVPASLREAWERMDESILLYVFERGAEAPAPGQTAAYSLVAGEHEAAPASTLSDWHTKGIKKLADALDLRDQFLASRSPRPRRKLPRFAPLVVLLAFAALLVWGGNKALRVYRLAGLVWQEASQLRAQAAAPSLATVRAAGPLLENLRADFLRLRAETQPLLRAAPALGWVPVYGGDIAAAPELATLADSLLASADQSYRALSPLLDSYADGQFDPARWTEHLIQAQPQLTEARVSLDLARDARARLDLTRLSPRLRPFLDDVDRLLPLLDDGLALAQEAPRLLGASSDGPKTYLLLAQNEDELRPTGGFITAAATLLVRDGRILSLTFQNSSDYDNWDRPYPPAPWQLQQYMNSPVLIFRDANWFADFRTSALYAEYLYSYANNHSVDGVIAFDQHALVELLRVTGPIQLKDHDEPVGADNVIAFMRAEKSVRTEVGESNWTNKAFINSITAALLDKLFNGDIPPDSLGRLLVKLLNEKHALAQLDDPLLADFLARRNWDGALRPIENGDFLMVVDSNVGFNKTNAVVNASLSYDVDLTRLESPRSQLAVLHQNNASAEAPCRPYPYFDLTGLPAALIQKDYPIDRCYWDYLRIYTLADAELLGASAQTVPADWTIMGRSVPPQVDVLKEEKLDGLRGFGTFKVVPGGQSLASSFRFALPASVLTRGADARQWAYRLKVQKEPGTIETAIVVRVHFPNGATVQSVPPGAVVEGQNVLLQSALATDLHLEFVFLLP